jgi:hypothetical protein
MKLALQILTLVLLSTRAEAQAPQKLVTHNNYSWVSINSNFRINDHWFVVADVHLRENDFFASNSFIFGRVGLGYRWQDQLAVVAGYANLLEAPAPTGAGDRPDEHRLYEQVQLSSRYKKTGIVQRLRNEQRWQSSMVNGSKTGRSIFSNRIRYLLSVTMPVSKNKWAPQLVVADECMLQFGPQVTYNTFEQNRIFFGIKQNLGKGLSFDAGYMSIFQQKNSERYTQSDVCRMFFYYSSAPKKKKFAN